MISIEFDEPAEDGLWARWLRDCDTERQALITQVETGARPNVKDLYKRRSIKDRYYFGSGSVFGGKCAYCETYLKDFQNPDVEHYRPKLGVTDENDDPVIVDYGDGSVDHVGYFWLAYDWRNLLPSCQKCNQASDIDGEKIGKHNRFPVRGVHACYDDELHLEDPLLLNPTFDNPEEHIRVNLKDGALEPIENSEKGSMTLKVLGLNVRERLMQRRAGKIRETLALFVELTMERDPERARELGAELRELMNGEYALVVRTVVAEQKRRMADEL